MKAILVDRRNASVRYSVKVNSLIEMGESNFLYMEIVGSPDAVKGIWARVASKRNKKARSNNSVPTGIILKGVTVSKLHIDEQVKYLTTSLMSADQKRMKMAIFHPCLHQSKRIYILGGTKSEPSPYFSSVLSGIDVPTLPEWHEVLWEVAVRERRLVRELDSLHGPLNAWFIDRRAAGWQKLVSELVGQGEVSWPA